MEKRRPATAPPGPRNSPPDPALERASSNRLTRSRLYKSQTPDPIEEAAASLFTRVRALIASQQQEKSRDTSPSNGAATSSYYGDDESPTSDRREWDIKAHSTSSSSGVVAFKSVPHRSVPESTFTNDRPMPPSYLHSSQPVDLGEKASSERRVGRVSTTWDAPSATTFDGRLKDDLEDSSGDDADEDAQVTDGGIDPEKVRRKVLDRPPSAPIPTTDPIVAVLYDSSSGTGRSFCQTPDLFPRKVVLKDYGKTAPTPANTIATPQPLLNVIPATPSLLSSGGTAVVDDDDPSVLVAHTGATTPEEGSIQDAQNVEELISAIESRDRIPDFEFENPGFRNSDTSPDAPGTISPPSRPSISVETLSAGAVTSEGGQDLVCSSPTRGDTSVLSYTGIGDGFEPPNSLYKRSQSLHQAFVNSDPRRISRRGRGPPKVETQASVPMSTSSFQRIIYDLEEMLNQALDLASRAVADSHTALNQRDASRSRGGSARGSITTEATSTGDYGTASFKTANELEQDEEGTSPAAGEFLEKLQDASVSTTAVYRDDGEPTSSSGAGVTRVQRSFSEAEFGSLKEAIPATIVNPRGYVELTRTASKAYGKSYDAERLNDQFRYQRQKTELQAVKPRVPVQLRDTATADRDRGRHVQIEEPARRSGYTGGWDWSLRDKRIAAIMACSVSGLISFVVGCYFGESAAMRKSLRISDHVASLGNVSFLIGVALPVLVLWPLPLLHGKKPYLLLSIALVVPLQLPQALSLPPHTTVEQHLSDSMLPYVICMMIFRGVSGVVLGFAAMIAFATIMDLFGPDTGACCRGGIVFNNHAPIEGANQYHMVSGGEAGSRIGVWLGIWAWLFVSFPGAGFFFGQIIADKASPAWGFWVVAMADGMLFFAVAMIPEVRPPWRRVVGERRRGGWMRRRVERGELALVVFGKPPEWWWEEVWAGLRMSGRMCGQVGFALLAAYAGWVVGEVTMVMRLLSSLISNHYKFIPVDLGLAILALPIAALISIPFQLSALYLRNFRHRARLPAYAGETHVRMGRHHYRSSLYLSTILLPLSGLGFTMSATGPPTHFMLPVAFAAVACFSGTLAVAECHILLWDNWDVSDLPEARLGNSGSVSSGASHGGRPHGTSRPAMLRDAGDAGFMTAHPAISAGMAIFHSLALLTAALAFGVAGRIEETIGVRNGVAIWVGIGFLLTLCLAVVLWRGRGQRVQLVGGDQDDGRFESWFLVGALQKGRWTRWSEAGELRWRDGLQVAD